MNGAEPWSIDRLSQQEAVFAERELPSYREAEMELVKPCRGCQEARRSGRLCCRDCTKRIAAEVKEYCDKAFDEVAQQMNMTRAECGEMLRKLFATRDPMPNDRQATDGSVPRSVGPSAAGGTLPAAGSDA